MRVLILFLVLLNCGSPRAQAQVTSDDSSLRVTLHAASSIVEFGPPDLRVAINRFSPQFRSLNAVGALWRERDAYAGTGFLVSPCLVLTNYHVVFAKTAVAGTGVPLYFSVGQSIDSGRPFALRGVPGRVVAFGNYHFGAATYKSDWALIKLSRSIGHGVGYLPLSQLEASDLQGQSVATAGFPLSKTRGGREMSALWGDVKCQLIGFSELGFMYHNCQSERGQSGSPIVARNPVSGQIEAVAMVRGSQRHGMEKSTNLAIANTAVAFVPSKGDVLNDGDLIRQAIEINQCNEPFQK